MCTMAMARLARAGPSCEPKAGWLGVWSSPLQLTAISFQCLSQLAGLLVRVGVLSRGDGWVGAAWKRGPQKSLALRKDCDWSWAEEALGKPSAIRTRSEVKAREGRGLFTGYAFLRFKD